MAGQARKADSMSGADVIAAESREPRGTCLFCPEPTSRLFWTYGDGVDLSNAYEVCRSHWVDVVKPCEELLDISRVVEVA